MPPLLKLSQKELAKLYKRLFKGENKLYRTGYYPTEKFSRAKQLEDFGESMMAEGEPTGIYWAKSKAELGRLASGDETFSPSISQTAAALPTARQRAFTNEEWKRELTTPWKPLTNRMRKKYDVIDVPDLVYEQYPKRVTNLDLVPRQKVQLNPRSVVTKIGNKYKILGAAPIGSVAAGDMSLTEWHEYQKQRGRRDATR